MENVLEKMKVLDYEVEFCQEKHVAPFARTAFALPAKNPSVQFGNFLDLVSWLCHKSTGESSTFDIDKFDDPNTSVNKMMLALRKLGFTSDFPVSKLKQGHGEACCNVLDFLCDKALESQKFVWRAPVHDEQPEVEEAEVDEDADLGEDINDDIEAAEEEEQIFGGGGGGGEKEAEDSMQDTSHVIIAATIDEKEWKEELERVGPRLKSMNATLGKEWRAHIEQTKVHEKTIQATLPSAQGHMTSISAQIKDAVEKMRAKEESINNQFEPVRAEYEELATQKKLVDEKHSTTRQNVGNLTNQLSSIQEQLDDMKQDMSTRESSATDTSPLVNIKHALTSIRSDVQQFDLRIGVVSHTLLQAKLRSVKAKNSKARSRKGGGEGKTGDEDDLEFDEEDDEDEDEDEDDR
jgi:estrogen-related receptor beta like 1